MNASLNPPRRDLRADAVAGLTVAIVALPLSMAIAVASGVGEPALRRGRRQHDRPAAPNCEMVAQGAANIAASLFGGMPVTGTIARTATNVRAGARGPAAGMFHALFLLAFLLVAAPLAALIPLSALAGVLAVVAWGMAEKHEALKLLRGSWRTALVLVVTFLLVIFRDLTEGILAGVILTLLLRLRKET